MKIHKPDNLALLYRVHAHGAAGGRLHIAMLALFGLAPDAAAALAPEAELWAAFDAVAPGMPVDAGHAKARGEFLVLGPACAPRGQTARHLVVTARVGAIAKSLHVHGERRFGPMGGISEPLPFSRMPMDPGQAFGGPSCADNPVGKGADLAPDGARALPNVEQPGQLMAFASDRPAPAGFGPLRADAPQRLRHLGAFDAQWLAGPWPGLPAGTHADYFQDAPEDQRIAGFWRGDEDLQMHHMHPDHPALSARLPGLRARCLVQRLVAGQPVREELAAQAETVWLLPERGQGVVLYRAVADVADADGLDVQSLHADWESLSAAPRPSSELFRGPEDREGDPARPSLPSLAPLPQPVAAAAPAVSAATAVPAVPAVAAAALPALPPQPAPLADLAELEAMVARLEAQTAEQLRQHGLTAEDAQRALPAPAMHATHATPAASLQELEAMVGELEAGTQAQAQALGLTAQDLAAHQLQAAAPPDAASVRQALDQWAANAQRILDEAGMSPDDLKAWAASRPELASIAPHIGQPIAVAQLAQALDELDAAGPPAAAAAASATAATNSRPQDTAQAPHGGTANPAAAEQAPWSRERVAAHHAGGHALSDLDLGPLDLSGLDLAQADFSRSTLEGARFDDAQLAGARFESALLQGASFARADLSGAVFAGARAAGGVFAGAQAAAAVLDQADFAGADFEGALLAGAHCQRTHFAGSRMGGVDASALVAPQADFTDCALQGARFAGAQLARARFNTALLQGADFSQAQAEASEWYGAQAAGARFENAALQRSRAGQAADFSEAALQGARLDHASWEGIRLRGARLDRASLRQARFDQADAQGACLRGVDAQAASFALADLSQADCAGSQFMQASLRRARLQDCGLEQCNLHGSDLLGSNIGQARTQQSLLTATLLAIEARQELRRQGAAA